MLMNVENLTSLSSKELDELYNKYKYWYNRQSKPLYKRIWGGRLLAILKEQQRRKNES